jgi:Ni,Fe-hydrogenase I large subunit
MMTDDCEKIHEAILQISGFGKLINQKIKDEGKPMAGQGWNNYRASQRRVAGLSQQLNTLRVKYQVEAVEMKEAYHEISRDKSPSFPHKEFLDKFVRERVRHAKQGYPEVMMELVSIKEMVKGFKRWADSNGVKRVEQSEILGYCEETFGDSRGKQVYQNLRVFLEEEDVEEFDKEHLENS